MAVDQGAVRAAKSILWPDEKVELTVTQRRIGPGGSMTTPTTVLTTDKRLIILNRASLGIRKDYEVIPYRQITSVRLEHGIISSTVFIRVQGYDRDQGLLKNGKEEGEIDGLRNSEAQELADYLGRRQEQIEQVAEGEEASNQLDNGMGAYVYCSKCGTKDNADAKFCSKCGAKLE
jgi:sec-independent protein translocase protein TatA